MLMDAGRNYQDESGTLSRTYWKNSFFRSCEKSRSQGVVSYICSLNECTGGSKEKTPLYLWV